MSERPAVVQYPYFQVDHHAACVYIYVADLAAKSARTKQITPHINADYDADDNVIGIELLSMKIDFGEEFAWKPSA